jgi:hypothetical protein
MIAFARIALPLALLVSGALALPIFVNGGDDCCQGAKNAPAKTDLGTRAGKALEMWKDVPKRLEALSAEETAQLAKAQVVGDRLCPVCKEMPATLAYLRDAFRADASLEARLLETCHGVKARSDADSPAVQLLSAALASADPKPDCCAKDQAAAKAPSCCAAPKSEDASAADPLVQVTSLGERATKLETLWTTTVPAALAAMPAADKSELDQALATQMKLNPRMQAAIETVSVLRELAASNGCCGGDHDCARRPAQEDPGRPRRHEQRLRQPHEHLLQEGRVERELSVPYRVRSFHIRTRDARP